MPQLLDQAEELIEDLWREDEACGAIASALVRAGDLDGALELATTLSDRFRRREVFLTIAARLLRDGHAEAARPVAAEALRLSDAGNWNFVVEKVGGFLPEVANAAGAEVLKLIRRS